MPITRHDIETYLGELSDDLVRRILAMGVTRADLAEVARQIESSAEGEEALPEETIAELCALVREDEGEELWADY
jgi:hypothetical protein